MTGAPPTRDRGWRVRLCLRCWCLALVLTGPAPQAQVTIGPGIARKPPFADDELHRIMQRTLLHMDAFHADSSLHWIARGLQRIDGRDAPEELYYLLSYRAEVLYYEGLFTEAMEDLDRCMPLAEGLQDSLLIANIHNLRGLLHENIHESHAALPHLRQALAWWPRKPAARYPVTELHHIHGNLGSYLMHTGELDSAAVHLPLSLRLAQQADAGRATAVAWWALGKLALRRQQPDSALRCFERSVAVATERLEHDVCLDGLAGLARARQELGLAAAAKAALERGRRHIAEHPDGIGLVTLRNFAREQGMVLRALGDLEGALDAMAAWHRMDSTITGRNNQAALRIQASLLRSDARLALERKERQRAHEALRRVRFSRMVLGVGSALAVGLLALAFAALRSRIRGRQRLAELELIRLQQEKTVAELRVREQVSRDMHDDIGAGLSGLKLRSEIAARGATDPAHRQLLEDIARQAGELIGSMRQIIWALTGERASIGDLVAFCANHARNYCAQHGLQCTVHAAGIWPAVGLGSEERRNLFLVVKEALHNTVKHARATTVALRFAMEGKLLCIEVADDGVGIDPTQAFTGHGLRNIRARIAAMGGEVAVHGRGGTRLVVKVPMPPANKSSVPPASGGNDLRP